MYKRHLGVVEGVALAMLQLQRSSDQLQHECGMDHGLFIGFGSGKWWSMIDCLDIRYTDSRSQQNTSAVAVHCTV